MNTIRRLGFWSAIVSAIMSVLWFITFAMKDVLAPVPPWMELQEYAEAFSPLRLLYVYPSLLLPLSFIALLVCIHLRIPEEKRVWSLIALSLGILYATMASINYNIQAVAVRQSLAAGETMGIEMFLPDNPNSVFDALANSYVYMALAMFAAGFTFENQGLQRWIRWIFFAQLLTALGQIGKTMFDLSMSIFLATSMIWIIGAPIAFVLLAILFARTKSEHAAPEKGGIQAPILNSGRSVLKKEKRSNAVSTAERKI